MGSGIRLLQYKPLGLFYLKFSHGIIFSENFRKECDRIELGLLHFVLPEQKYLNRENKSNPISKDFLFALFKGRLHVKCKFTLKVA